MHPHALGISQRIAQLKERDIGVLRDQFLEEGLVRRQLALAAVATGVPVPHGPWSLPGVPIVRQWQVIPSDATPPRVHLPLLQSVSETAFEAPLAKLLT